jgi:alpha-beta hydrolase superfamily lysophospholipase
MHKGTRRFSHWLAFLLAGLMLGGCVSLEEKEREWIFRPSKAEWRGYSDNRVTFEERWIEVNGGRERLNAWWLPAASPEAPVLLYLHGARWNLTGSVTRIPRWQRLGFSVLAIDYRGFGKSDGDIPSEASVYEDAQAAWSYLKRSMPLRRRYIAGHSLGGAIAVELARHNPDAAGLVLEATFTSVPDMVKESNWGFLPLLGFITQRFDVLEKMHEIRIPTLLVHGTQDAIVPTNMSRQLFEAARAPEKLIIVEGGTHHNLNAIAFEEYRSALDELFGLGGAAVPAAAGDS